MLHKDSFLISEPTFSLIQELQSLPGLAGFHLVGGTSLTLQLGHRNSIDIDLFTLDEINNQSLIDYIIGSGFDFDVKLNVRNTIIGFIAGVKVDFVRHNYPLLHQPIVEEGITFLGKEDIAAMKLNAISNSGKRLKDFIDVYYLLEHFSMDEMVSFYATKYPHFNPLIALRSVNYFNDIDPNIDPPKLREPLTLSEIKKRINDAVLHSKKKF
jgi:hypothetical protein